MIVKPFMQGARFLLFCLFRFLCPNVSTATGWNFDSNFINMYFEALSTIRFLSAPFEDLPDDVKQILFYGNGGEKLNLLL